MKNLLLTITAVSILGLSGSAYADQGSGKGNAYGREGCSSAGAPNAKNPGHFFQELKKHPSLAGQNPSEIAKTENTTPGWDGYQKTPNVGAFIDRFCG